MTVEEQVLKNLENIRAISGIHPRLALAGIGSEVEILVRDLIPPPLMSSLTAETSPNDPYPATTIARRKLANCFDQIESMPPSLQDFCRKVLPRADECRHKRTTPTYTEIAEAINGARLFVEFLKTLRFSKFFRCSAHDRFTTFRLSDVFKAEAGGTFVLRCSRCKTTLLEFVVPRIDECEVNVTEMLKDGDRILARLGNAVIELLLDRIGEEGFVNEEIALKVRLMRLVTEPVFEK